MNTVADRATQWRDIFSRVCAVDDSVLANLDRVGFERDEDGDIIWVYMGPDTALPAGFDLKPSGTTH